jgi:hypothetical protein
MQHQTNDDFTVVLFSGEPSLRGTGEQVYCKVLPLGRHPVLRITWDGILCDWVIERTEGEAARGEAASATGRPDESGVGGDSAGDDPSDNPTSLEPRP